MSKLNRVKNKNIATKEQIEKAFQECKYGEEDTGVSICGKIKTSCKYAINNGICEALQELATKKKKVVL